MTGARGATAGRDQQFPLLAVSGYQGLKRPELEADYSLVSRAGILAAERHIYIYMSLSERFK